ncbi:MAG: type II secretion system protein [Patescibacteria group bacterium]
MSPKNNSQSGVTLLEILLVVGVIAIISAFSLPVYESFKNKNDLSLGVTLSANALRRASELAMASDGDSKWGVKFVTSSIIIFKGDNFASRDSNFDEKSDISSNILISDTSEVVFQKYSGLPLAETTTTFSASNGETAIIHVNLKSAIIY